MPLPTLRMGFTRLVHALVLALAAIGAWYVCIISSMENQDKKIADFFRHFPHDMGFKDEFVSGARPKRVFLIGDSLIELSFDPLNSFPLGSALSHAFRRRADVLNRGLSGYSSKWMGSQFERVKKEMMEDPEVFMVVLMIGTNDSVLKGNPHHVDIFEFERNVSKMVKEITNVAPSAAVIVVTPPPCSMAMINDPNSKLSQSGKARSNEAVELYASVLRKIVRNADGQMVRIADLHLELSDKKVEEYLSDGVHLNGNGYKTLFILIFSALESLKQHVVSIPLIEPHFSVQINNESELNT